MESLVKSAKEKNLKYEIFYSSNEVKSLSFEQSEVKDISHKKIEGVGVRILHGGKLGFSSSNDIENSDVIDYAYNSAKYSKPVQFDFPEIRHNEITIGKTELEIDFALLLPELKEIIKYLEQKYQGKVDISLNQNRKVTKLINYKGEERISKSVNFFDFSINLFSITSSGFLFTGNWDWSLEPFKKEDLWRVVSEMEKTLIGYDKVAKISTGKHKVIFTPFAVHSTLGISILQGINGKNLAVGSSPLKQRLNEKILDEKITLTDDPTLEFPSKSEYDDEGLKAYPKPIIENGVLKSFLMDLDSASDLNLEPTGNGLRGSFGAMPSPQFHFAAFKEGEQKLEDIVKNLDKGIIFLFPIGAGQSNIMMGDYSANIGLGYYIENGEIVGRVKDTMIAGNVYEDCKRILAVSKDTKVLGGMFGNSFYRVPYYLVDGVSITTK